MNSPKDIDEIPTFVNWEFELLIGVESRLLFINRNPED